jgi:type II secretory pathway component GspD/PulD (secretin)/tetratricopeptide (TPR) repeat protein
MTTTHRSARASASFSMATSTDAARRRHFAIALAVGLTSIAVVPVLAELRADPVVTKDSNSNVAFLSALSNEQPATSAAALAQGQQQLADKQYEEALSTLLQAKADELDPEQQKQLTAALIEVTKAAGERKASRAAFEEGEKALAAGDNLAALKKYGEAKQSAYADAATIDKANTQTAVAVNNLGDLKAVYESAKADLEKNDFDSAKAKFVALDSVGYKAGLLNKSPADYLKVVNEKSVTGMAAAPVADAALSESPVAEAPAAEPTMTPEQQKKLARQAYVAGRDAYHKGDIIAAKANFQRAVELNYKKGFGETGPQKMLVELDKKDRADAARAAMAARESESTAMAAAAPSPVTSDSPPAPAVDAQTSPEAAAIAANNQPAAPADTMAPPAAASGLTTTTPDAAPEATPTPAVAANDLQATADAERIKHETNVFRAKQYVMQADQAKAGGRYNDSISLYDEALALDPNNTGAQAGKAEAQRMTGREVVATDALSGYEKLIQAKKENIRFTVDSSLQESQQARAASNFTDARRALIKAQSARDSDTGIFTREELAQFDSAIRSERGAIDSQETSVTRAQAEDDRRKAIQDQEIAAREAEKRQRETVAALIKHSRQLSNQGRYEDAVKIVDQILSIEPRNDYALGVRPLLEDRRQLGQQRQTMEKINRDLVDVLNLAEESRVPIPDLLVYPTDWPDISRMRDDTIARERGGATDQATEALLARTLPELRFDGVPFVDVVEFLRDTTQANVFVNWTAIEGAGIDKNAPITTRLRNVKFSKVLNIILESAGGGVIKLGYTIDDGVITISTQDDLAKNVATRTYDIRDLLIEIPDFTNTPTFNLGGGGGGGGEGGGGSIFSGGETGGGTDTGQTRDEIVEQIIDLIKSTIASDTWKDNGGVIGAVQELGGQLIVTQTPENQTAIGQLLEKLRETRAIQVNVEARFLTVQRNFLEEIGVDFDFQFNVDYANFPGNGFNPNSDFSPVLVNQNNVTTGVGGTPTGFTSPGQLVTGLSTNLGQEAQNNAYGLSTSVSAFLDDFRASLLLRAVQLGQNATTLTAPKLTLFNGQQAYIYVSTEQAYVSDLTPIVGTQAVGYDPTISYVNSGVLLAVQATVSADRKYVTLTVRPTLSRLVALRQFAFLGTQTTGDLGNTESSTGLIQTPEREVTSLATTVSVPDRGTLLLGGQTIMGEVERESGTPVLSKIPFLKRLFTNRGTAKDEQVLLILVKPTIIIQREVEATSFPLLEAQ